MLEIISQRLYALFSNTVIYVLAVGAAWFTWRLWSFTVLPWCYPEEPREVPYWIPVLGHTLSFLTNSNKAIQHGLEVCKRSREPFAITLIGIRFYILTSPEDVTAAYRNTTTLSWDYYMGQLMSSFGLDSSALQKVWHEPKPGDQSYFHGNKINPKHKSHVHFTEEMYQRQLLPGDKLNELGAKVTRYVSESLRWKNLLGPAIQDISTSFVQLSLKAFCRGKMIDMITQYMFGNVLYQMEPNITEHMIRFNDDAWMVLFHYPEFMTPKLAYSRRKLLDAFKKYVKVPREQRADGMWGMQNIIESQEQAGISDNDRASLLLLVYWAAGSNAVNTLFWMATYLVFYPELREQIKQETLGAFQGGELDTSYLVDQCPRLEAFFLEVLRMINGALGVRQVEKATRMNGKVLQPGNTLVIPFRQLNFDGNVWGENSHLFDPERFLKDKSLGSHAAFRPFGGGVSYCPGRFLVRQQVFGFVTTFFHRFDIELPDLLVPGKDKCKAQVLPKLDETRPSTGTTACVEGMDVFINVRKSADYKGFCG